MKSLWMMALITGTLLVNVSYSSNIFPDKGRAYKDFFRTTAKCKNCGKEYVKDQTHICKK